MDHTNYTLITLIRLHLVHYTYKLLYIIRSTINVLGYVMNVYAALIQPLEIIIISS